MNDGQSFTFPSFESYNYPSHKDLTFHQIQANPSSQYELSKDSMIRNFPGKKFAMGKHLQIVLLLQAAQIERLTINLQQYRTQFKRLSKNEKDFLSFQNQANELLHLKDELELKSRKMNSYVKSQEEEINDQSHYSKSLEGKYKRALKFIEEAHIANHKLESVNQQLKGQIYRIEQTFEAFKSQSIHEYQMLREDLQRRYNDELSLLTNKSAEDKKNWDQVWRQQQKRFNEQKQRLQEALRRQQSTNGKLSPLVEQLSMEVLESRGVIQSIEKNSKKSEQEKLETMAMIQTEIQRLNLLVRQKVTQLKKAEQRITEVTDILGRKQTQINDLSRQNIRVRQKNELYEQQITRQNNEISKLSTYASNITTKVNEMGILIQQKNVQIRIKEDKLQKEMENYSGVLSKSEFVFNKQIEDLKYANINLARELERKNMQAASKDENYRQRQMSIISKLKQAEAERQQVKQQIIKIQSKNRQFQENIIQQNKGLRNNLEMMNRRLEVVMAQKRQLQQHFKQFNINYEQGLKRSYEQNLHKLTQRLSASQNKIINLEEIKSSLQKTITYLKQSLQRSERQRQQSSKNKSFLQMIAEIEHLCQSTINKDNQIIGLKDELSQMRIDLQKSMTDVSSLKELLFKVINNQNLAQSSRVEGSKYVFDQIKKLFEEHSDKFQEVKYSTHSIVSSIGIKHRQLIDATQNQILQSKQFEINDLRERLGNAERTSHSQMELKEIINKIIVITKQNSELRNESNKKVFQLEHQMRINGDLKREIVRNTEQWQMNLRQKQEICKKLLEQLEQSHNVVLEQKQNELKLQRCMGELEAQRDSSCSELQNKKQLIDDLKRDLRIIRQQSSKTVESLQYQRKDGLKLKEQINSLKRIQMQFVSQKEGQIDKLKRQVQKWKQQSRTCLQNQKKYEIEHTKLQKIIEGLSNQITKLNNEKSTLIRQNNALKDQTIKAGSSILLLSRQNQSVEELKLRLDEQRTLCEGYRSKISQLVEKVDEKEALLCQFDSIKMENELYKREQEKNQKILYNYGQKVEILTAEFQRLETIIEDLKRKNNQLMTKNYNQTLTLQKHKITEQKIAVLSEQIERMGQQKINLTEEVNLCRMEISKDSLMDRQIQEQLSLFILLFAEIEALRQRLISKDKQIQDLRKIQLSS